MGATSDTEGVIAESAYPRFGGSLAIRRKELTGLKSLKESDQGLSSDSMPQAIERHDNSTLDLKSGAHNWFYRGSSEKHTPLDREVTFSKGRLAEGDNLP